MLTMFKGPMLRFFLIYVIMIFAHHKHTCFVLYLGQVLLQTENALFHIVISCGNTGSAPLCFKLYTFTRIIWMLSGPELPIFSQLKIKRDVNLKTTASLHHKVKQSILSFGDR
ncbi:hypothetical protein NL108_001069 [Boleophthalmus pectinirostris]|nr:hypothetical protein NL108_001069 [Boleophthalmus pectinirostris]